MHLQFTADPAAFLTRAHERLAADPVLSTVVATWAAKIAAEVAEGGEQPVEDWWLTVYDTDRVVGVAMRTAPFVPRPAYVLSMPDEAAVLLARALHERGEDLPAANGALPAVRVLLEETARLAGGTVEVEKHTRLFELTGPEDLRAPRPVSGLLRRARPEEVDLVAAWFVDFEQDADEQAGRPRPPGPRAEPDPPAMRRRIAAGTVWLWEDAEGGVVHLLGASAPAYGVARIGPVYTPPAERGRGWAGNAVAEMTRQVLADGSRACLFTDQANPTSNRLYESLGYRPVVDMADLVRR